MAIAACVTMIFLLLAEGPLFSNMVIGTCCMAKRGLSMWAPTLSSVGPVFNLHCESEKNGPQLHVHMSSITLTRSDRLLA